MAMDTSDRARTTRASQPREEATAKITQAREACKCGQGGGQGLRFR